MLGDLLGSLSTVHPPSFPEHDTLEDAGEDTHWSDDTNRFEDWLLHPDADNAPETDAQNFY